MRNTKTERSDAKSWVAAACEQGRGQSALREGPPLDSPRIRIDVPLGTSYLDIQASVFRQAWQLAGTQLRAALALGITPETISRVLRKCDRELDRSLGVPAHKLIEPSVRRIMEKAKGQTTDKQADRFLNDPVEDLDELKFDD